MDVWVLQNENQKLICIPCEGIRLFPINIDEDTGTITMTYNDEEFSKTNI